MEDRYSEVLDARAVEQIIEFLDDAGRNYFDSLDGMMIGMLIGCIKEHFSVK